MKITSVIPTYNEAENITRLIPKLFELPLGNFHVLIVDDNSSDGTGQIADEFSKTYDGRVEVIHRPGKLGLGSAYVQGFQYALENGADVVGQMDADFSHPPEKLVEMKAALESCDVVVGSRYIEGGSVDHDWPIWRKGLSAWGNFYARTILGIPISDCTGAFRLIRRDVMERIPLHRVRSNGYVFQVELIYLAYLAGAKFGEVPIYFADRQYGTSKMSLKIQIEAAIRVWMLLFQYRDLVETI